MRYSATIILLLLAGGTIMADVQADKMGYTKEIAARIQRDTEKYRKDDAIIQVVDDGGRPVPDASVKVEQTTHDFLFGCNIYMFDRMGSKEDNAKYCELFKRLLNYATIGFYWRSFEFEQGKRAYEHAEKTARWCRENGITTKGHPLVWPCHDAGIPDWLPKDNPVEVQRLMEERTKDIVSHYAGLINIWDAVNESTHGDRMGTGMSVLDLTSKSVIWAREADPNATLIVNEFGMFTDKKTSDAYFALLRDMKDAGVPYDAIGMQSHMHGGPYPIPAILNTLDRFAVLGKPIHLTETTLLSGGKESTPEGERKQAAEVERFYRACFSHPSVRAITWWDFSDRGAWQGVAAGLIRKDLTPKPAYLVLDRLINHEWRTNTQGKTDVEGTYRFRGFHGSYQVTVTSSAGHSKTAEFHLADGKENRLRIVLDEE